MRLTATFIFMLALAALVGCGGGERSSMANAANVSRSSPAQGEAARAPQASEGQAVVQNVSLQQADAAQNAPATIERKIIRNANVDRKSTRLNSSHDQISYAVFCLKKKKKTDTN